MRLILSLENLILGVAELVRGLLAGETINLTWFQQMPDNYEGDYYLIISIDNLGTLTTSYIDSTPLITLMSQGTGTTSIVNTSIGETTQPSERPDTSFDGRFVTYEKTQVVNGKELQQIYIIDMQQTVPVPKLISRAYSSSLSTSLPANGDSFRPKISADGSTVVFYSNASNLVPGDTNNKEDVYLYRLSTDTIFRAVITWGNGSETEQLNGRSLYPDVNGDGSKIVFESDADNERLGPTSGSQIFLWELDLDGGGSLEVVSKVSDGNSFSVGNANSYNPSIDDAGNYVVFDSYSTNLQTDNNALTDTNGPADIFLLDLNKSSIWRANLNFNEQTDKGGQSEGGPSLNPKISGDGTRIVYESRANNLIQGGGIAKVEVIQGGYGYEGKPTVRIFEDDLNESGAPGSGAFLSLKDDGINLLQELKTDAILILDSGSGYTNPRVEISHDPAFGPVAGSHCSCLSN